MNKQDFIQLSTNIGNDTKNNREKLATIFDYIHDNLECWHEQSDVYYIAHYMLYHQYHKGPMIEFGCYKGGMSCKLSHVAKLINKEYIIFDSFQGLLHEKSYSGYTPLFPKIIDFKLGMFCENIENVIKNIKKFGNYDCCSLVSGEIEKTLTNDMYPFCIFIDVDIVETTLFIIQKIWNNITTPCLFIHEGCIKDYIDGVSNNEWWLTNFNIPKPLFGHEFFDIEFGLQNSLCLNFISKKKQKELLKIFHKP